MFSPGLIAGVNILKDWNSYRINERAVDPTHFDYLRRPFHNRMRVARSLRFANFVTSGRWPRRPSIRSNKRVPQGRCTRTSRRSKSTAKFPCPTQDFLLCAYQVSQKFQFLFIAERAIRTHEAAIHVPLAVSRNHTPDFSCLR